MDNKEFYDKWRPALMQNYGTYENFDENDKAKIREILKQTPMEVIQLFADDEIPGVSAVAKEMLPEENQTIQENILGKIFGPGNYRPKNVGPLLRFLGRAAYDVVDSGKYFVRYAGGNYLFAHLEKLLSKQGYINQRSNMHPNLEIFSRGLEHATLTLDSPNGTVKSIEFQLDRAMGESFGDSKGLITFAAKSENRNDRFNYQMAAHCIKENDLEGLKTVFENVSEEVEQNILEFMNPALVSVDEEQLDEKWLADYARDRENETLTGEQKKKRDEIVRSMQKEKKSELQSRYGKRWKDVMYATATKKAMGKSDD